VKWLGGSFLLWRRGWFELGGLVTHLRVFIPLGLGSVVLPRLRRLLPFDPPAAIPTIRTTWRSCLHMLVVPRAAIPFVMVVVVPPIVGYSSIPRRYSPI